MLGIQEKAASEFSADKTIIEKGLRVIDNYEVDVRYFVEDIKEREKDAS